MIGAPEVIGCIVAALLLYTIGWWIGYLVFG